MLATAPHLGTVQQPPASLPLLFCGAERKPERHRVPCASSCLQRLEAQAQMVNVARSCSLPLTAKLGSPPMSRGAQQGWLPPHARAGMQAERGGWTAAEHLRQQGGLESIVEPGEEGFLPLG